MSVPSISRTGLFLMGPRRPSGKRLGYVDEILGDPKADIFDGLNVSHGLLSGTEYVPSERVAEIREGQIVIAQ